MTLTKRCSAARPSRPACGRDRRERAQVVLLDQLVQLQRVRRVDLARSRRARCCSAPRRCRRRRARRRPRRSCPPRSCARSGRGRRRGRRSCTRSRGRRRPRRRRQRAGVAHREALAGQPAEERRARRSRRRARCCRRSRSPRRANVASSGGRTATTPPDRPLPRSRWRRRSASARRPGASQAPNDWPAEPCRSKRIVSGGQPVGARGPGRSQCDSSPPTVRLTLRTRTRP